MRVEHIREFVMLYRKLSYARAARELFISQSSLSRHIKAMEDELGCTLFVRDQHNVEPTDKGKVFYREIRSVVNSYDRAVKAIEAAHDPTDMRIRLSYLASASAGFLRKSCQKFNELRPGIELQLSAVEYNDSFSLLENNEADLLISLTTKPFERNQLESETLYEDVYCICVGSGHKLADKESIAFENLRTISFRMLNFDPETMLSKRIMSDLTHAGIRNFNPLPVKDVNSIPIVARPADSQDCILMNYHLRNLYDEQKDLRFIPIRNAANVQVSAVWKKAYDNPEIRLLVAIMKKNAAQAHAQSSLLRG